jgi:3-oxoadipate enol-lactonase
MQPLIEPTLQRWFTPAMLAQRPPVVERVAQMIGATTPAGFAGCCHAIPKINLTHRLNTIDCPVQVIVGEQDVGTPVAMAREIHEATPGSELVIIPNASHLSNLEQPEAFNRALLGFLDRH